ncbi:MAG: energy-coupling factor transporter transmembrane component T [Methanocellales archaeon]
MLLKIKFERKKSFIHKLDPRAKLLLAIALASYTFIEQIYIHILIFILIILISTLGKVMKTFIKIAFSSLPIFIFIFSLNYLYLGLEYSLMISLRFLNLILIFSAIFLTTTPDELSLALNARGIPQSFSFILISAVRFMHLISREADEITQAYIARCGKVGSNFVDRLRVYKSILIPLIAISIRRSITMAEALEMRGFGTSKRTSLREMKIGPRDVLVILISIFLIATRIAIIGGRIY